MLHLSHSDTATDVLAKPRRADTDVPDAYHEVCHCEWRALSVAMGERPPYALCGFRCSRGGPGLTSPPPGRVPCPLCPTVKVCPRCGCPVNRPGGT